jgi:hypothetical protein
VGPLGAGDELSQLVGLGDVAAHRAQQAGQAQLVRLWMGRRRLDLEHVFREVEQHRPRPAGAGDLECLGHRQRDLVGVHDHGCVLRDRQRDADDIGLLECVLSEQRARHVARDGDHRHRVHHRRRQPGDEVDRARAGGGHRHAHAAGRAAEPIRRVCATLFVPHEDVPQRELSQDVVDRQDRAAGIAEDRRHALANERLAHGSRTDPRRNGLGPRGGVHRSEIWLSKCAHGTAWVPLATKNPAWPSGWRDSRSLRFAGLSARASSIPPSKEDDDEKNADEYDEATAARDGRRRGRRAERAARLSHWSDPSSRVK